MTAIAMVDYGMGNRRSVVKAFARALRAAVAVDPAENGVPSTKGTLTA